jgi:hypothetical protein
VKSVLLALKLLLALYLVRVVFSLLTACAPGEYPNDPPLMIFILDIINLFIHEAGHFLLRPFGRWVSVFGGSFMQVFLPAALLAVTWRQKPGQAPFPAIWLGESMVNASVYIADAPYRNLRLIAPGLTHDWYWLLEDYLEAAEPLAWVVFGTGILVCCGAILAFVLFAIRSFREYQPGADVQTP